MAYEEWKRAGRTKLWLAVMAIVAGLAISGLSLVRLQARDPQRMAQGTPSPQVSPSAEPRSPPAEAKPGGTRPTTPAPEPDRPDPAAQKAGVKPVLPPAPAEKIAPPIKEKR